MKLQLVPARTGWTWIALGCKTFMRQPLALAGLFFMFMLLSSLVSMVPGVGTAVFLILMPAASLGLMAATREAEAGSFPMPAMLFAGLRGPQTKVRRILLLGVGYAMTVAAVLLLVTLIAGDALGPLDVGDNPSAEEVRAALTQRGTAYLLLMVLYMPVSVAFWHAPVLVHWHGVPPSKALFFSCAAFWANKGAMLVYLGGWMLVAVVGGNLVAGIAGVMGGAAALQVVILPVVLLGLAVFHTSVFFTFRDSFSDDAPPPADTGSTPQN